MAIRCASCGRDNRDGARYCFQCGSRLGVVASGDPLIGRVLLDRYRILSVLGEGGMGRVYLAEQQMGTAARKVAVKVLHEPHSRDTTLRRRFYGECEVVIHLSHPNTIQFYDFGELPDGRLFIVMEYIEGRSVAEELREGPLPGARVERLLSQIAGSLQEAHDSGVVHRDLKPENILLTVRGGEPDFVKVCDFGIAKREQDPDVPQLTLRGTVIGTPQYMSPEQLTGGEVDGRSDVYSLGLILYEMLAGQRPFEASSPLEWSARHTTTDPPPLSGLESTRGLPEHQQRAVMRALAKLPHERPDSPRALAAEFLGRSDATTPVTMSARPPGSGGAPAPPTPTRQRDASPQDAEPRDVGQLEVNATAPTVLASPVAVKRAPSPSADPASSPELEAPLALPTRRRWPWLLAGAALLAVGAGGVYLARRPLGLTEEDPERTTAASPDAGALAGPRSASDAGASGRAAREWIRIVHFQRNIDRAAQALGPPDGRFAVVPPHGTITLELAAGTRIATDGASGPDVFIDVDDARSEAYRADVGVARHQFTTVGSELVGSLPLDADQFGIRRIRYVRIKNRGTRPLYLDAVGAYRTVPAGADDG